MQVSEVKGGDVRHNSGHKMLWWRKKRERHSQGACYYREETQNASDTIRANGKSLILSQ